MDDCKGRLTDPERSDKHGDTLSVKPWRIFKQLLNSLPGGHRLKMASGQNQGDRERISNSSLILEKEG